jgi:hypothetical protein
MSYTETTVIDKKYSQKDTGGSNACYRSKQNILSLNVPSKIAKNKIQRELYHYSLLHVHNEAMTYVTELLRNSAGKGWENCKTSMSNI